MSDTHSTQDEGFDFLRKMWGNVRGFNLPGMVAPTFDIEELEQHIKNLKAVESWLKMNLNMLQMSIQGLEIQHSALATVKAMTQIHESSGGAADESLASLFANPAMWTWPFGANPELENRSEANAAAKPDKPIKKDVSPEEKPKAHKTAVK